VRPTWGQVRQFCIRQGYEYRPGNHDRYFKVVGGRHSTGTMISHGVDGDTVPTQIWLKVWKYQLKLAGEDEFWSGLEGKPVQYDIPPTPELQQPLPDYLDRHLRDVLHWSDEQIAQTTRDQAQELLNAYYARELREP
jgi:hypothetical protein